MSADGCRRRLTPPVSRPADHGANGQQADVQAERQPQECGQPVGQEEADDGGRRQQFEREQVLKLIDEEIQKLPTRQREAFLMRYWEDMDVAETAAAMGCSEGSVKTHCSRATHTLAVALKAKGITL